MKPTAAGSPPTFIAIDGGSTNTRVWLLKHGQVEARSSAMVGVRDTVREGSPAKLHATVRDLIAQVRAARPDVRPTLVAGAGMITSSLGLAEVPHVMAPAGVEDLARGARQVTVPGITDLPCWLFPGVRCRAAVPSEVVASDVMRGEETLCVGLTALGRVALPGTILTLGSHWKLIELQRDGAIARSRTSISGELIHSVQTGTVLASSLPEGRLEKLDVPWCRRGMAEARKSGLPRALFCVRMLDLDGGSNPEQRMSFLLGAFVEAELVALLDSGPLASGKPMVVVGSGAVAEAWRMALVAQNLPAQVLAEDQAEAAFLAGLGQLVPRVLNREEPFGDSPKPFKVRLANS